MSARPQPQAGDAVGEYAVNEILAEGSYGTAYLATRPSDMKLVALKLLHRTISSDEAFSRKLELETKIARDITHPHLAQMLDRGDHDGRRFVVFEYIAGRPLADRLKEERIPFVEVARLVSRIGSALDELHHYDLVHQDVKPSNIILHDERGFVLTDFGLARGRANTILSTRRGQTMGSLDYIAPEIIKGGAMTAASDLYAFGCVVYECLMGVPPFSHRRDYDKILAHLEEDPPNPAAQLGLSGGITFVVLKALAKDPNDRPASGREWARLLRFADAAR